MSKEIKLVVYVCIGVGILAATLLGLKCCCKDKCCAIKRCRRPKGKHHCCEEEHDGCCECEEGEKVE